MKIIILPATLQDDLDWSAQKKEAEEAGNSILWNLDFGFFANPFCPYESSHFLSYSIAIDHFLKEILPQFHTKTIGLSLYQGDLLFLKRTKQSEKLLQFFEEFLLDFKGDFNRDDLYTLFCADLFSEYLHRLASILPETLPSYCILDLSSITSQAKAAQLLCRKRFEHFQLKIQGSRIPIKEADKPPLALCLPVDEKLESKALLEIEGILENLLKKNAPFRIIPEELLNEQWDELEQLIVIPEYLTSQGKRMLQGFEAAGGQVINNRSRGI